jgi:hypothetical protein
LDKALKKGSTGCRTFFRDPARIQTWNLLIRSQILYSVELRGHLFRVANIGENLKGKWYSKDLIDKFLQRPSQLFF